MYFEKLRHNRVSASYINSQRLGHVLKISAACYYREVNNENAHRVVPTRAIMAVLIYGVHHQVESHPLAVFWSVWLQIMA